MDKILLETVAAFTNETGMLLYRIQTDRSLDESALRRIEALAGELSVLLKPHLMLPKALLNDFRTAIRVLRNEARSFPEPSRLNDLAERLEVIFDLILMGETPEDRIPGRPRVV